VGNQQLHYFSGAVSDAAIRESVSAVDMAQKTSVVLFPHLQLPLSPHCAEIRASLPKPAILSGWIRA
jgi:hypothetical protein